MKLRTKIMLFSLVAYSLGIVYTTHWGGFWLFLTFVFVLGLGYDIHCYIRLRQGKPIVTIHTIKSLIKKDDRRWFCASCGEQVGKVTWDEDRDNDFCDDCY